MVGTPQDQALATEAPFPDDAACAIRWAWPTARVLRHVRALAPAPGAWTEIEGALVTVIEAAPAGLHRPALPARWRRCEAGRGVADGAGERAVVRTGDGAVVLLRGEIDGAPAGAADLAALFLRMRRARLAMVG